MDDKGESDWRVLPSPPPAGCYALPSLAADDVRADGTDRTFHPKECEWFASLRCCSAMKHLLCLGGSVGLPAVDCSVGFVATIAQRATGSGGQNKKAAAATSGGAAAVGETVKVAAKAAGGAGVGVTLAAGAQGLYLMSLYRPLPEAR